MGCKTAEKTILKNTIFCTEPAFSFEVSCLSPAFNRMMDKQLSDLQPTLSTLSLKRNLKHLRY